MRFDHYLTFTEHKEYQIRGFIAYWKYLFMVILRGKIDQLGQLEALHTSRCFFKEKINCDTSKEERAITKKFHITN